MHDTNLLNDQPIAWTPTHDVIERAQLTKFMRQVGVATWDELYEFSIRDVENFTEEVLNFLDIKFDPPYEKLLDISNGIETPTWFGRSKHRSETTPVLMDEASSSRQTRSEDTPVLMGEASSSRQILGGGTADEDKSVLAPHKSVFAPASLNITTMCLDRWQTGDLKDEPAVIWEGEEGGAKTISYSELFDSVIDCAEKLCDLGLGPGDAVGIHLPMIPETVAALLAINRIGAIAVPIFSGYGIDAITSRMEAVSAKAIFTCYGFPRRGKAFDMLTIAARAVANVPSIESVIVVDRHSYAEPAEPVYEDTVQARDRRRNDARHYEYLRNDLFGGKRVALWSLDRDTISSCEKKAAAPTAAEDPLIILYTSGTTGKPKGIVHTHASFPVKAAQDMAFGTDVSKGTRISWYTDIGWMMGPWLIYGALINGATICIYDGAPDYPTPDRIWEFCARHKVEVLGISPTLIRALAANERSEDTPVLMGEASSSRQTRSEDTPVLMGEASSSRQILGGGTADEDKSVLAPFERHDLSSLRLFASTGEPWNPAPWWWLFEKVGNSKLPIINYSGGTEIAGGILMGNPLLPQKPCSFPAPCPGMDVDILDEKGKPVGPGEVGELVIRQPWIGIARGFWQEKERYLDTYWRRFKNIWVHGDFAMRDGEGHWFILGRSDDTLKVAGKRVGPAEVESLLVAHPLVTEAAVIGVPDEAKGTAMVAFVVRSEHRSEDTPVLMGEASSSRPTLGGGTADEDKSVLAPFEGELKALVARDMGKPLAPSQIHFVSALPKTRNAKVMRRVIRAAYLGEDPGDLSALEDPQSVVEITKAGDQSAK